MSDFKWEMQERIDAGMSPDAAYNETRDAYAGAWDNRDKFSTRGEHLAEARAIEDHQERKWAERHPEEVEYAKREDVDAFLSSEDDVDESGGVREQ